LALLLAIFPVLWSFSRVLCGAGQIGLFCFFFFFEENGIFPKINKISLKTKRIVGVYFTSLNFLNYYAIQLTFSTTVTINHIFLRKKKVSQKMPQKIPKYKD